MANTEQELWHRLAALPPPPAAADVDHVPNSEVFSDYPTQRTSLRGTDEQGRSVVAFCSRVRVGGIMCACCETVFEQDDVSVMTKIVEPDGVHGGQRYKSEHFLPLLDSWTAVSTLPATQTTYESLTKWSDKLRVATEQKERAERDAGRTALTSRPGLFITRRSTDIA